MKKIFFLVLFSSIIFSQSKFKFDIDYSRFNYDDSSGYFELYYNFYSSLFKPNSVGEKKYISGGLNIVIDNLTTSTRILDQNYKFEMEANANTATFSGLRSYRLNFGKYKLYAIGSDLNSSEVKDTISFDFEINKFPTDKFSISDIQISTNIKEADELSSKDLIKSGYEIFPNPSMIFGNDLPIIFTYTEFYNIDKNIKSEKLILTYKILNAYNQEYLKKTKLISREKNSILDIATLNISNIPSGTYNLVLSLADSILNYQVFSVKRIFIYNPEIKDQQQKNITDINVLSSEYAVMSIEELEDEFSWVRFIATQDQQNTWKKLTTIDGKRNFLFEFWKAKDNDLTTPVNEVKLQYLERIKIADRKYASIKRKGSLTDRGRVILLYGEPNEVERFPNDMDTRPYEIWKYDNLQSGVIFVFADLMGNSDYQLIHSTLKGELRDDNWSRRIRL